jgi:hypothetical protein
MRRLLAPAVVLCALAPATANAGTPFTVGEGDAPHLAVDGSGTAHVVWVDNSPKMFYCQVPRGAQACAAPPRVIDQPGTGGVAYVVHLGSTIHLVSPNYPQQTTVLWTSTDGGATFAGPTTVYKYGGQAGSSEPVPGPLAGEITLGGTNPDGVTWGFKTDGSESAVSTRAEHARPAVVDFQIAPTCDGGLVGVGHDGANASFFRMAPGGDPSVQGSWGGASVIGAGDTTGVAGGPGGTYMLASIQQPPHQEIRKWNGAGFGAPVSINELGYINDIFVSPSGGVGAIWRMNGSPDQLRFALSTNGGASFALSSIAAEEETMQDMDVALAGDNVGWAVYEGARGSSGARNLIRVVDTTPIGGTGSPPPPPAGSTIRGAQAFTQGVSNDLYLACTTLNLMLIDVLPSGPGRVAVAGAADLRLAGQTVQILLDGVAVGQAVVGPTGAFQARVRAPSRRRRARARYQARVGDAVSQALRLRRRMVATTLTRSGGDLVLRGRVNRPFSRRVPVEVERFTSCGGRQRVTLRRRVRPSRTGTFAARFAAPPGTTRAALYRARTRVPRRRGGRPIERTFTLPRAIDLR